MSHNVVLKEGAYIISDAHYSQERPELLSFFQAIADGREKPSQLILMGDIFDALFGLIPYTYKQNQKMIDLLKLIAQKIEVVYLEGNHDFNLSYVFEGIKIFPIAAQPVLCEYQGKKVYLAHGDFYIDAKRTSYAYKLYTSFIRNKYILRVLRLIDNVSGHAILNNVDKHLSIKDDCKEFIGFEAFIQKRLGDDYPCEYFIEGHYHQNRSLKFPHFTYINLGAFACNQRYFIVKSSNEATLLEEKIFS
jgi:UDP-2,3-diacylglucosamine hydrolase